jgi:hypothetical protein
MGRRRRFHLKSAAGDEWMRRKEARDVTTIARESVGITGDHGCHHGSAGRSHRRWLPRWMERYTRFSSA